MADPLVISTLRRGGVVVLRTDTLYGILARASDEAAVERVYHIKDRDERKSPIVLISSFDQLFDTPSELAVRYLSTVWPGKVSVILPALKAPQWLQRQNASIAYRLPDNIKLMSLLDQTGPLIAPSANPEGHVPALSFEEAYDYFGDLVDVYVDGGRIDDDSPSQLIRFDETGEITRLR